MPVHNGAPWIDRCFQGIVKQTALGILDVEVCVCNDRSTDQTPQLLQQWENTFESFGVALKVYHNHNQMQGGGELVQILMFWLQIIVFSWLLQKQSGGA